MMNPLIRVIALILSFGSLRLLAEPMHVEYPSGSGLGHGKQVVAETWVSHWGNHQVEATRGVIEKENAHALMYGFNQARPNVRPSAHAWDAEIWNEKN